MTKRTFDKIAAGLREAQDVAAIIAERDAAGATNIRLRAIIGRCAVALGNGAFIADECSDDFRERLPDEIAAVIASLTRERDEARAALTSARAEALEEAARWHDAEAERLWLFLQTIDDNGQVLRAVSDIERRYAMKASSAIRALKEAQR